MIIENILIFSINFTPKLGLFCITITNTWAIKFSLVGPKWPGGPRLPTTVSTGHILGWIIINSIYKPGGGLRAEFSLLRRTSAHFPRGWESGFHPLVGN